MKHIHITGVSPRTGTTLLAEMMRVCFEIDCCVPHEASVFSACRNGASVYLTKHPTQIAVAGDALRRMPNLYVVSVIRDPRDVVVSRHSLDTSRYWVGLNFWKLLSPYERALRGHVRVVTIRYENLVSRPDEAQTRLMNALPFLRARSEFSRFAELARPEKSALAALGGVRPVSITSVGSWRNHLPRLAGQIKRHGPISDDLIEHGYESDCIWERRLSGIDADLGPSFWPDEWGIDDIAPMKPD